MVGVKEARFQLGNQSSLSLSLEVAPEVVVLSGPLALYRLSVQWVYTVPVTRLGGGNLRVFNRTTASSGGPAISCRRSMSTLSWFVSQCL